MRIASFVFVAALCLALTPSIGSAQERRFHVNLGGGPTFNAADVGDHFSNGWGPAIGLTIDGSDIWAFQFEYAYRWFDIKDDVQVFNATRFSANHSFHQLDFNVVANLQRPGSAVRPYIVGGPGAYNRKVEIEEYVGNGVVCDPFWYVCGVYPVTDVVGSRGGWDFGFNVGGGVGFGIGDTSEFFMEMRYHHVYGPEITPNVAIPPDSGLDDTDGGNTNGSYYPLTFGFRF